MSVGALLCPWLLFCMWPKEHDFFFYCCSSTHAVVPSMTHTAGSACFHKSHKSQGPVMTFTLSCRAVNALPLSATWVTAETTDRLISSLSHCLLWLPWPKMGILWNPKHACQLLPIHGQAKCWSCSIQVSLECWMLPKCLLWKDKDIWENRRSKTYFCFVVMSESTWSAWIS